MTGDQEDWGQDSNGNYFRRGPFPSDRPRHPKEPTLIYRFDMAVVWVVGILLVADVLLHILPS